MDVLTERTANIVLADDDEDEDDVQVARRVPLNGRRLTKSSRRRRRSSARFLKLSSNNNGEDDEDGDDGAVPMMNSENLGEVYQNAIRMNAENKINASNSWNLNLIDHMDRFLSTNGGTSNSAVVPLEDTLGPVTGVNFTKASCTLDASVKIYSYRVDDVHLTSYKVLANLNRTDTGKKGSKSTDDGGDALGETATTRAEEAREERRAARSSNTETLESNLANINIHKLDAAFDIDPLFHKMSKTFDEGGAKGLLLANLNVGATGCNIVFDSTLDDDNTAEEDSKQQEEDDGMHSSGGTGPSTVDVSSLTARLEASLNGQTVHQLPLVPQLATLRTEFAQLTQEGFVENVKPSKRYAAPKEDEAEADRSIHVEAMERSRASQADLGRSLMAEQDEDDSDFLSGDNGGGDFAPDDFGGADDDDDEENVMGGSDSFPVSFIHDGDHRFSSESFQTTFEASRPPSQATVLLDAIAAGDISGSQSNYEYFNKKALETIQGNNQWAGAAHWKKMQPKRKINNKKDSSAAESQESAAAAKATKKRKGRAKAGTKGVIVVDISKPKIADLKDLLQKPPKGKKGSNSTAALQMTKAAIAKASKNENLLPLDAGIKVENFTSLFLRPNTNVMDFCSQNATSLPVRQVGFGGVETWGNHDDNNSYGGDDDGPGFDFGGGGGDYDDSGVADIDFVAELEGVRKVEKVKVGYATVAKKVDVKRLKTDLWEELERTFEKRGKTPAWEKKKSKDVDTDDDDDDDMDEAIKEAEDMERLDADDEDNVDDAKQQQGPLSFQDTVREMQATQSQSDVTLSFYFICILHLANEKGLALESCGLEDFIIHSS